MPTTIPAYFEAAPDPVFALLTRPSAGVSWRTAVLLCPPWGWDEVASYRSQRRWAQVLAEAGHPTLRFFYQGTGDSAGDPGGPALVDAWVGALQAGADHLRESHGPRVATVGLGFGGLVAREAISRGAAIDELVLWAAPASGRAFVREALAFSRLQEWSGGDSGLQEDWIEAGGFLIGPETNKALRAVKPRLPEGAPLRRVLLLDRDGTGVDASSREGLEAAGVEVAVAPGPGWGLMVSHPERSRLPLDVAGTVESWLREGEDDDSASRWESPQAKSAIASRAQAELQLEVEGRAVLETPLTVEQPFGRAFGILTTPCEEREADLCGVFLNAGAVSHIGPNRIWVETARRWAARGVSCMRVDLEAIGEADGDEGRLRSVSEFYDERYEAQVQQVLDALQARGFGNRFLLVGLCAGGFWSFRAALRDARVEAAVLLNAGALVWHENILGEREARKISQARQWRRWKKLLSGSVERERLRLFLSSSVRLSSWRHGGRGIPAQLDRLRDRGVRLTLAFSGREPLAAELEREQIISWLQRWPNVALHTLPGNDHTLRPLVAQRAARELLDQELQQVVDQLGTRQR